MIGYLTSMAYSFANPRRCDFCGETYSPRLDNLKKGKGLFCSRSCASKAREMARATIITCLCCGKDVRVFKKGRKYCSRACAVQHSPPNWNPDRAAVKARKKMASFCCRSVYRILKGKPDRVHALLGYGTKELVSAIERTWEPGMSWENYGHGTGKWNIDHIRPIASFDLGDDLREINALSNLQALWHTENCSKGKKYEGDERK